MKITFLSILLFALIGVAGCKKESPTKGTNSSASLNSFSLKKNGVLYNAGKINITSSETSEYIGIEAHLSPVQMNIETYAMSLYKNIEPGIYNEDNSPISLRDICAFVHIYNEYEVFIMEDGEITILSNDTLAKIIEFDFKFDLYESLGSGIVTLTEGHCKINY